MYKLESDTFGDHTVHAYSRIGLVIALYVISMVCFCLPYYFDAVNDFSMFTVFAAFSFMTVVCLLNVSFGSKVTPNIFGYWQVGITLLSSVRLSSFLYSAGSGVNRVAVDLSGLICRSFSFVHSLILFRYGCRFSSTVL